jgi:hypothetical protein
MSTVDWKGQKGQNPIKKQRQLPALGQHASVGPFYRRKPYRVWGKRQISSALRNGLTAAHAHCAATLAAEQAKLDAHPAWQGLPPLKQAALLQSAGITLLPLTAMGTDEELLSALENRDLAAWKTLAEALPTRCAQPLAAAIKEAEPKAQRISLPGATIRNQAELEDWLADVRVAVEAALAERPVIL